MNARQRYAAILTTTQDPPIITGPIDGYSIFFDTWERPDPVRPFMMETVIGDTGSLAVNFSNDLRLEFRTETPGRRRLDLHTLFDVAVLMAILPTWENGGGFRPSRPPGLVIGQSYIVDIGPKQGDYN